MLVCDNKRKGSTHTEICINQPRVEIVSSFNDLGAVIDRKLAFGENTDSVHKKHSNDYFLFGKLKSLFSFFYGIVLVKKTS